MIINLGKKGIKINPATVPEPLHKTHIQYVFELNTNHLTPVLRIGSHEFSGNRINIDLEEALKDVSSGTEVSIRVDLMGETPYPLHVYEGSFTFYKYGLVGNKKLRPDFNTYIEELEAEIERLQTEGEVI